MGGGREGTWSLILPQLWIVAGPNGAGKTTLVSHRLARRIVVVNPDDIARDLPRLQGRLDERQAGEIALNRRSDLLQRRTDFAIETTLTGSSALRLLALAKSAGYKVTLVYIGLTDAVLSAQRVLDRVRQGGHAVPVAALERRYPAAMSNLVKAMRAANRSYVLDNSGSRRRLLLIREEDVVRYCAGDLPEWASDSLAAFLQRLP